MVLSFLCFINLVFGHLRATKDVAAGDGMGGTCPIHIVLHADVTRRVGSDDEHDQGGGESAGQDSRGSRRMD